jgi:hypothetical protein
MVSFAILFVADFFQPVHCLTLELFPDGDVRHGGGRSGTMPVFFPGWKPDDVTWPNFLDRSYPALHPAATGGDDEGLAQRMSVPGGSGCRFERDDCSRDPRRIGYRRPSIGFGHSSPLFFKAQTPALLAFDELCRK